MRLVCISDTHGAHAQLRKLYALPTGDVLVHAGDLTNEGRLDEVEKFGRWLAKQPFRRKMIVAGNHDWCFEDHPEQSKQALGDCDYLQDSGCVIDGLQFWGSPWTSDWRAVNGAFSGNPPASLPFTLPRRIDVLITHAADALCLLSTGHASGTTKVRLHLYGHRPDISTANAEAARCVSVIGDRCFDAAFIGHFAAVIDIDLVAVSHVLGALENRYLDYCQRSVNTALDGIYVKGPRKAVRPTNTVSGSSSLREHDWIDGHVVSLTGKQAEIQGISFRYTYAPVRTMPIPKRLLPRGTTVGDSLSFQLNQLTDGQWQSMIQLHQPSKRPRIVVLTLDEVATLKLTRDLTPPP